MKLPLVLLAVGCSSGSSVTEAQLGALEFNDPALSQPAGQACADCHSAKAAFRDPESDHATSAGVVPGRFGSRNAPTTMYASLVPPLHLDGHGWVGGLFWDGRAPSLAEQAAIPMLNPLEMHNESKASVVDAVRRAPYADKFRELYGAAALDNVDLAFIHVTQAIAAYEQTAMFAPFNSKYDHYLAHTEQLTPDEQRGLAIFEAHCASCHPDRPGADGSPPRFTNDSYANLGIPRYKNSMFYKQATELNPAGAGFIDHGLMTTVNDAAQDGKFRVPTLRNIARTPPYGHNGYFANLPYFIDFLNTRDIGSPDPAVGAWPPPEVPANVDKAIGKLGLSPHDVDDLIAFLETLTDATSPQPSR